MSNVSIFASKEKWERTMQNTACRNNSCQLSTELIVELKKKIKKKEEEQDLLGTLGTKAKSGFIGFCCS